jgi:O-antigen/teichoic acid export membrane protein
MTGWRRRLPVDARSISATALVRIVSLAASLGTLALTARWLGPEGRGVTAGATAWAALVAGLCHLSVAQVIVRDAAARAEAQWVVQQVRNVLLLGVAGVVVAWIAVAMLAVIDAPRFFGLLPTGPLVMAMLMVPWLVLETYAATMLPGIGALRSLNTAQLTSRAVAIGLLLLLVAGLGFGVIGALAATLGGLLASGAIILRRLWLAGGRDARISRDSLRPLARGGALLHLNAVGAILLSNVDVIVVQQTQPLAVTGIYQLAVQAAMLPLMLPQAAATVFYGRVSSLGADAAWRFSRGAMVGVLAAVATACALAALLAPWVVTALAGPRFGGAVPIFRLLLIGTLAQSFSAMMAPQWIGRGLFRTASAVTLCLGVSTLIALRLLVPRHGIDGAVAVVVTASLVTAAVNAGFARWVGRRVAAHAAGAGPG